MQVRPADPVVGDLEEKLTGPGVRLGDVLHPQVVAAMQPGSSHVVTRALRLTPIVS